MVFPRVCRYADNILKTFANAISILLTGVISFLLFDDFVLTMLFVAGSTLVIASTFLYSHEPPKPPAAALPK